MSEEPDSRVGEMFGPYHLVRQLGRGGMGEVYQAEHTVKGWTVAVKLMSESVSKDPVFRERMKREARIAGRLQEPHVVPIHDYGEIDGQMFLEMRLIEGSDLDSLLASYGPQPAPRAVAIIAQIASALDAAHTVGVMHRDVKPPNILVTHDDFAYLVDFGIASANSDEKLTQMGTAVGTWKYMAPERFTNDEVTFRADIYSLACVLYECLTGSAPYQGDNAGVLISAHMISPIPRPSAAAQGVPRALDEVIACGMAKKPADRYASAGDLARAAQAALSDPDRDHVADIVRRSQEYQLPPPSAGPRTIQNPPASRPGWSRPTPTSHPGPGGAGPPRPSAPTPQPPHAARPGPSGYRTWAPSAGPTGPPSGPTGPPSGPTGPPSGPIPPSRPIGPPSTPIWPPSGPIARPSGPPPVSGGPPPAWGGGPPQFGPPQLGPPGAPPQSHGPMPWNQQPAPGRNKWAIVAGAAALVLVLLLGGIGIWAATKDDDDMHADGPTTTTRTSTRTTTPTTTRTTTPSPSTTSSGAQTRLMGLLPPGYPAGSCKPDSKPMAGALASVTCGQNTDTNGPKVSAFGLYPDVPSLKKAFTGFTSTFTMQNCPGNNSSPATWGHAKDPKTILGQIACGVYKGADPQVMWTNEQTLVYAIVGGKAQNPTLDQLYKWWTTHS